MPITDKKVKFVQKKLLKWFKANGRDFLWRNEAASNYVKIISEVLLQRTKAETVNKFLPKFLDSYPDWTSLGNANEAELIKILHPLGLSNQRGKRLFKPTQELKSKNWEFPKERLLVEEMPMMGQYITNAYELFILKNKAPLLDVNMARVLERVFGNRKLADIRYDPFLQLVAKKIANHPNPIEMNWAILDLGSKVCTSKKPECKICPLNKHCSFQLQIRNTT